VTRVTAHDGRLHPRQTNTVSHQPRSPEQPPGVASPLEPAQRWRVVFRRDRMPVGGVQYEPKAMWEAALAATDLPLVGLDVPHGRPRLAIGAPLSPAIAGEAELLDLWLTSREPRWRVREALLLTLPAGHEIVDVYDAWLREPALPGQVVASVYRATIPAGTVGPAEAAAAARAMLDEGSLPRVRAKGEGTVRYDLRPFLEALAVSSGPDGAVEVRMILRHDPERGVGRPEEVVAELADRLGHGVRTLAAAIARERLILASDQPPSVTGGGAARNGIRAPR
jgi:Uncharacterized protein conserved in bacteria (DUF2344)